MAYLSSKQVNVTQGPEGNVSSSPQEGKLAAGTANCYWKSMLIYLSFSAGGIVSMTLVSCLSHSCWFLRSGTLAPLATVKGSMMVA